MTQKCRCQNYVHFFINAFSIRYRGYIVSVKQQEKPTFDALVQQIGAVSV